MGRKPRDLFDTITLAHARLDAWDLAGARVIYVRVLAALPEQVDALYGMARVKLESNNVGSAHAFFGQVIERLDSHLLRHAHDFALMVRFHYGRALFAERRFDEALVQWEKVQRVQRTPILDVALRRARFLAAGASGASARDRRALDEPLRSTIEHAPERAAEIVEKVEGALERSERDLAMGAEAELEALWRERPSAELAALLGTVQLLRGAPEAAWETVVPFLAAPGSATAASRIGTIANVNARWAQARDAYQTALELRDDGIDWLALARASVCLGDARGACNAYLNARTFLRDFRPVLPELRQLLVRLQLPYEAGELAA